MSLPLLGFLIGVRHALDADHVAAVLSLATRGGTLGQQVRQGVLWGLGHSLTLLVVAGACVLLGVALPADVERWFEALVGLMLVVLGLSVFARIRRRHPAPRHSAASPPRPARSRALFVGAVHGLAGSAALALLAAQGARGPLEGLLHVASFGAGSMAGMAVVAAGIAVPLKASARRGEAFHRLLCGGAGALSILIGAKILWTSVPG